MRTILFIISASFFLTVTGCSTSAPPFHNALPTIKITRLETMEVESPKNSSITASPTNGNGFSIYLLAPGITPQNIPMQSHLDLEKSPLISDKDIFTYDKATHEIELTSHGYNKIASLSISVYGKAFAVCVNGQLIYTGAFWVGYSSVSFDGIVIDTILASEKHPVIQIQLGYPGPAFFHGNDPRSDNRILQALEQAGKLK